MKDENEESKKVQSEQHTSEMIGIPLKNVGGMTDDRGELNEAKCVWAFFLW